MGYRRTGAKTLLRVFQATSKERHAEDKYWHLQLMNIESLGTK